MLIWDQSLIKLFEKGGFAMWPLLICSVAGLTIILERAYYFLRLRMPYESFRRQFLGFLAKAKKNEALKLALGSSNPVARLAALYLKNLGSDALREDILKREGSLALEKVEARLQGLAAVAHIAPLLGLLGTVTGLVTAFHQIEKLGGQVGPADLAAGIWEALITTVFGLVIAIPCMAAYHSFASAADRIARRMQFIISDLDEFFGKHSASAFASASAEETVDAVKTVS
jgi:biopolymer transport protein ExbB